ncbi:DNA ligase 1 isoform X2 [Halyomorpha halys]|uniref:DNA ligase 1 isoform X2 n=1 Tax=Halyomorpha halys TaxID=286706 RepID=UPI0006D4FC88
MSGNRKPLKIGVRLEPPALVCIYKQSSKLRMRVMPLRNVWPKTDSNFLFDDLRSRHGKYLESIPREMIMKMINIIKEHKQGAELQDILKKYSSTSSGTKLRYLEDERQSATKFIDFKRKELMEELNQKSNSDDEDLMNVKRNIENKNKKDRSKFTLNKKSHVTFGKQDSNSDSDEYDFRNNKVEVNFESDDDFELNKVMKDKDLNKIGPHKSTLTKNELTEVKNFPKLGIRDSSKNFTKEIVKDVLKTDNKGKNQLKDLLDMHNKIESASNSKISKSEDDTDVEFDDSDIPLEEDFY